MAFFCVSGSLGQEWDPWTEFEGRVSNDRSVVRGNLFAPIWQNEDSMFFFDFRGLTTNQDANEGNAGFGYRKQVGPDRLVGFYGFYDFRETEFGNQFHQGSLGAELLSSKWGFRINGYLPQDDTQVVSALNTAFLSGGNVFVRQGLEGAYRGFDIEAERLLWKNESAGNGKSPIVPAKFDAEWWASVGFFHFEQENSNFENITGPRLQTELRLWNLNFFGADSRLVLSGQYEYDEVRGSVGTGGLAIRIPLGRSQSAPPLSGIRRRMLASVVRDVDIITNAGAFGDLERAKFARTNELISGTVTVDGNTADPEAVIEGAGANSLVLADGSAGTIFPAGTVDMNRGQVILGGGSVIGVVGCDTGAHANFAGPGSRPTFRSGVNDGFVGATNGALVGINFGSTLDDARGLVLNNVSNFLLEDVMVSTIGTTAAIRRGYAIEASNSQFVISNSRIMSVGTFADGINSNDSQFAVRNSTIDAGDDGIDDSGSAFTIVDSTIISEDDTLDTSDSVVSISGSTIIANAFNSSHSLIDDSGSYFAIDNTMFVLNGVPTIDAIGINTSRSFVMTNSTLRINNGAALGIEVDDVPVFTLANSTIHHLMPDGTPGATLDFDLGVNSNINISNTTVVSAAPSASSNQSGMALSTTGSAVVSVNMTDSSFTGMRVADGAIGEIVSNDTSNLTFNLIRSTLSGSGASTEGIDGAISNDSSTLNLNIVDSTLSSETSDGLSDLISNDMSTLNVNILRASISGETANQGGDEGIDDIDAYDSSTLNIMITDSFLTGGGGSGDGIDNIEVRDNARMTAVFTRSSFIGNGNDTDPTNFSEGIEDITTSGTAELDLTIIDSIVTGYKLDPTNLDRNNGPAIEEIRASNNSMLRFNFSGTQFTGGAASPAIALIQARNSATVTGSLTNNTLVGTFDGITAESQDTGTVNLELTGNTLTSGVAFDDLSFNQMGGSDFNVVDLPNVSGNNNGATFNTTGTIDNIIALP